MPQTDLEEKEEFVLPSIEELEGEDSDDIDTEDKKKDNWSDHYCSFPIAF